MYEVGTWKNANKENEVLFGVLESSVIHIHNLAETVCWGDHEILDHFHQRIHLSLCVAP